ncbi:MAG: 30S ribosomal protein S6e [bacterium]|nr:30S ribosomal protein S6e [bacterium]
MKKKVVVSDPKTGKAYAVVLDERLSERLVGYKIGDIIEGELLGLPGYKLKITGGSDFAGFPMHPAVHGMGRFRVLLSRPPCFHPRKKGERRRKTVHGNVISPEIVQVNTVIVEYGQKPLEELLGKKE